MSCLPIDSTPVLFYLDFEVDHVQNDAKDPLRSITQMAAKCPSADKNDRYFEAYIKPPQSAVYREDAPSFIPGKQEIKRHRFKKVWPAFKNWVDNNRNKNQQAIFVMHNGFKHDWPILKEECARIGTAIPKYFRPFCTLFLANALRIQSDRNASNSVSGLCEKFNIKKLPAHNALNDVEMLSGIFEKMIGRAEMSAVLRAALTPVHPVKAVAEVIKAHQTAMIVFFDFESTGLFRDDFSPRAVELAGYIPEKDASFESLINPDCPIPKESQEIHGISDGDVKNAPGFKAVWLKFEEWIEENKGGSVEKVVCLAGHNIWNYDLKLYKSECERVGLKPRFWKSLDTLWLSRHLHKGIKGVSHKMQELRKRYDIPADQAHRAGGDVRVNSQLFQKFVQDVPEEKLHEAIFSKHPIYAVGAAIRQWGAFNANPNSSAHASLEASASRPVSSSNPSPINPFTLSRQASSADSRSNSSQKPDAEDVKIAGKRKHIKDNKEPTRVFKRPKAKDWVLSDSSDEE